VPVACHDDAARVPVTANARAAAGTCWRGGHALTVPAGLGSARPLKARRLPTNRPDGCSLYAATVPPVKSARVRFAALLHGAGIRVAAARPGSAEPGRRGGLRPGPDVNTGAGVDKGKHTAAVRALPVISGLGGTPQGRPGDRRGTRPGAGTLA
jgi:hypothetical protein